MAYQEESAVATDAVYDPHAGKPHRTELLAVDEARVRLAQAMELEENCRRAGDRQMQLGALRLCIDRAQLLAQNLHVLRAAVSNGEVAEKKPEW